MKKANLANTITKIRLFFSPLIILSTYLDSKKLFLTFFILNSVLDFIDGFVARCLKIETNFGRKLDTIVDNIVILTAILMFFPLMIGEVGFYINRYYPLLILPILTYLAQIFLGFKYKKHLSSFHFYTAKFAQLPLVLFFASTLLSRFDSWLLLLAVFSFVISNIEGIVIYVVKKEKTDENVKTIFKM